MRAASPKPSFELKLQHWPLQESIINQQVSKALQASARAQAQAQARAQAQTPQRNSSTLAHWLFPAGGTRARGSDGGLPSPCSQFSSRGAVSERPDLR